MRETVENQNPIEHDKRQPDGLRCHQFDDAFVAYVHAVNGLRRVDPYAFYKYVRTYCRPACAPNRTRALPFSLRGTQVVADSGRAISEEDRARALMVGRHTPSFEK
ncbi:MAG: hypothetical protein JSU95_14760 [Betaproteobacteria bacterium]|nr:MAG: hypothetical protein JSU95_14760 [Betaproteobacteria bacterium]